MLITSSPLQKKRKIERSFIASILSVFLSKQLTTLCYYTNNREPAIQNSNRLNKLQAIKSFQTTLIDSIIQIYISSTILRPLSLIIARPLAEMLEFRSPSLHFVLLISCNFSLYSLNEPRFRRFPSWATPHFNKRRTAQVGTKILRYYLKRHLFRYIPSFSSTKYK